MDSDRGWKKSVQLDCLEDDDNIYICIYIERERERESLFEKYGDWSCICQDRNQNEMLKYTYASGSRLFFNTTLYTYEYKHLTYIYIHVHTHTYTEYIDTYTQTVKKYLRRLKIKRRERTKKVINKMTKHFLGQSITMEHLQTLNLESNKIKTTYQNKFYYKKNLTFSQNQKCPKRVMHKYMK